MKSLLALCMCVMTYSAFAVIDHWETIVYENDTWRYLVPTSNVPSNWNTLAFNDASWQTGSGGFGFGDGDDNTIIPQTVSCFQRIVFNVVDIAALDALVFNIDYDDAFVAYINGVEIGRDNITIAGQPSYNLLADGNHEAVMYNGGYPKTVILSAAWIAANLVNGSNVLCVQVHNVTSNSSDMSSRVWLSAGINNTSSNYGTTPGWFVPPMVFSDSNLPIVVINTAGNVTIPDDMKVNATMGIIYNGEGVRNYLTDPFNEFDGNIGIEVRGSSSQMFPKKQYGLETRDNLGIGNDVSLFNMAYDNDWVLYAPYSDKSLMRNVLAYQMGWDMGFYAPRTKFCEVVLNGEYQGVYVLTEKIKRKDGKVGTDDVEITDVSGNELTGDYVLKIDKTTGGGVISWYSPVPPYPGASQNIGFQLHDPPADSLNATQINYIRDFITDFELALNGANFSDPLLGYQPYVDIQSFVHFFLVNEVSRNVDGYRISSYINKIRTSEGGTLNAGPLWDFNLAFGNANYCSGGNTSGWELDFYQACGGDSWQNPFWWKRLLEDDTYTHSVNCTWQELRQGKWHTDSLMQRIDDWAAYLEESQLRNFERWPVLGVYVWPNNYLGATYAEEVDYLKTWLTARLNWLDMNMYGSCPDLGVENIESSALSVYPNPAKNYVHISFPEALNKGQLYLLDLNGKTVLHLANVQGLGCDIALGKLDSGLYQIRVIDAQAVFNGKILIQQ